MSRALITQLLEALEMNPLDTPSSEFDSKYAAAITAAREYLAAPEQSEPVAWATRRVDHELQLFAVKYNADREAQVHPDRGGVIPLYTHPAPEAKQPVNQQLLMACKLAEESLGAFVSDHGWAQRDMDNMDTVTAAIAAAEQAQPAGLTEAEIEAAVASVSVYTGEYTHAIARAIEAAHGIGHA